MRWEWRQTKEREEREGNLLHVGSNDGGNGGSDVFSNANFSPRTRFGISTVMMVTIWIVSGRFSMGRIFTIAMRISIARRASTSAWGRRITTASVSRRKTASGSFTTTFAGRQFALDTTTANHSEQGEENKRNMIRTETYTRRKNQFFDWLTTHLPSKARTASRASRGSSNMTNANPGGLRATQTLRNGP